VSAGIRHGSRRIARTLTANAVVVCCRASSECLRRCSVVKERASRPLAIATKKSFSAIVDVAPAGFTGINPVLNASEEFIQSTAEEVPSRSGAGQLSANHKVQRQIKSLRLDIEPTNGQRSGRTAEDDTHPGVRPGGQLRHWTAAVAAIGLAQNMTSRGSTSHNGRARFGDWWRQAPFLVRLTTTLAHSPTHPRPITTPAFPSHERTHPNLINPLFLKQKLGLFNPIGLFLTCRFYALFVRVYEYTHKVLLFSRFPFPISHAPCFPLHRWLITIHRFGYRFIYKDRICFFVGHIFTFVGYSRGNN
jgi:hypothetical protein